LRRALVESGVLAFTQTRTTLLRKRGVVGQSMLDSNQKKLMNNVNFMRYIIAQAALLSNKN